MLVFANRLTVENPYLLIVRYSNASIEKQLEALVSGKVKKHSIKSKSVMPDNNNEVTYEIRLKDNDTEFINQVKDMDSVQSAIMLSYDGNFTA